MHRGEEICKCLNVVVQASPKELADPGLTCTCGRHDNGSVLLCKPVDTDSYEPVQNKAGDGCVKVRAGPRRIPRVRAGFGGPET